HLVNPSRYDAFYWKIDNYFRPVIDLAILTRRAIAPVIPYEANFYMISFIAMFYVSFLYHAINTPGRFGTLITSVVILQFLGSLAYMIAPAVGPFIYEPGANPLITEGQDGMLAFHD